MEHSKQSSWGSKFAFAIGNLGHAAFYGVLSNYFIIFVTSAMFVGLNKQVTDKLIGLITGLIVVIRIIEIMIDPLLGNIVDNTRSRWGKFKPWILIGTLVSSVLMMVLFTGIFNLVRVSWLLYAIAFVIIFILLDVFYSFADVSYWGMVPALSEDSVERGVYSSLGAFTGSIGWNGLTVIVVPVVVFFTYLTTGHRTQGAPGWFAFATIISILAIVCALIVCLGAKEKQNLIRQATANQRLSIKDVFKTLAQNDQLLWASFAYFLFSLAQVITNGVLFYFFKFVLDAANEFWIVGIVATIVGLCTSPLYPILNRFIARRWLYAGGMVCMIISYLIFIFGTHNLPLLIVGLALYNFTFAQLVTILILTDSIEYGQLKNGTRSEAVVLAIRPMLDKLTGAFSNGLVGYIAIAAGMTGAATAADMTAHRIHLFMGLAFYIPLGLAILSLIIFLWKVKLTEKAHAQIVDQLTEQLAQGQGAPAAPQPIGRTAITDVLAPVDGELIPLSEVKLDNGAFPGAGFAIKPTDGHLYAPFDGIVRFTFSTHHVLGLRSTAGLDTIIHVGIDTVNLRGEGFVTYYEDGQRVHAGDRLMDFDPELIHQHGLEPTVVLFFTHPQKLNSLPQIEPKTVHHGDLIYPVQNQ